MNKMIPQRTNEIKIEVGVNNCYYNYGGYCTHPNTCKNTGLWANHPHNWDSKKKCMFTNINVKTCNKYKKYE